MKHRSVRLLFILLLSVCQPGQLSAQRFSIAAESDSVSWLVLTDTVGDGRALSRWRVPYPIFGFAEGDVDGNGTVDAILGVVKSSRFHPEKSRRLCLFKQVDGRIRPLWLGSRLGTHIEDFRFVDGAIRCLHRTKAGTYLVADYRWGTFGPTRATTLLQTDSKEEALKSFLTNQHRKSSENDRKFIRK